MQTDQITNISIDLLEPNIYQPRKNFNDITLNELALSIKEYGILNPILVRKKNDKYEIIAGERRVKAAKIAGLTEIPAIIKEVDDKKLAEIALIENLQRENITPIEEAKAYEDILNLSKITEQELSYMIGKSQSFISNKLRLLSLPNEIQEALSKRKISERHARSLLSIKDEKIEIELLNEIIANKLTVKELENIIKEKNLNLNKKEEKESDKMNNNFFPNVNEQQNDNVSLNTMNMQAINQPTIQQPVNNIEPAINDPNVIQFPNMGVDNLSQTMPLPTIQTVNELPTQPIIQPENEPQPMTNETISPIPTFSETNNNSLPTPQIMQPSTESVTPSAPILPEQPQPNIETTLPSDAPLVDIPLFDNQNQSQNIPTEPVTTPSIEPTVPPVENQTINTPVSPTVEQNQAAPLLSTPEPILPPETPIFSQPETTTTEIPITVTNEIVPPVETAPNPINNEPPVINNTIAQNNSQPIEEDKFAKVKDLLTATGVEFKAYSNETGHCIIIEL